MTPPLLQSKAGLRRGKVGLPKAVTATLFNDHIEISDGVNQLLSAPLNQMTEIKQGVGYLSFKVGQNYYSLEFSSLTSKMFGLLGLLLSSGRTTAKAWSAQLESMGLAVKHSLL